MSGFRRPATSRRCLAGLVAAVVATCVAGPAAAQPRPEEPDGNAARPIPTVRDLLVAGEWRGQGVRLVFHPSGQLDRIWISDKTLDRGTFTLKDSRDLDIFLKRDHFPLTIRHISIGTLRTQPRGQAKASVRHYSRLPSQITGPRWANVQYEDGQLKVAGEEATGQGPAGDSAPAAPVVFAPPDLRQLVPTVVDLLVGEWTNVKNGDVVRKLTFRRDWSVFVEHKSGGVLQGTYGYTVTPFAIGMTVWKDSRVTELGDLVLLLSDRTLRTKAPKTGAPSEYRRPPRPVWEAVHFDEKASRIEAPAVMKSRHDRPVVECDPKYPKYGVTPTRALEFGQFAITYKRVEVGMCWTVLAEAGNAEGAATYLGEVYSKGWGVPKDAKKALEWYGKAVQNDDRPAIAAMKRMAEIYASGGPGVERDAALARRWQAAADAAEQREVARAESRRTRPLMPEERAQREAQKEEDIAEAVRREKAAEEAERAQRINDRTWGAPSPLRAPWDRR